MGKTLKSLALLKVKIEKFEVSRSPVLTSLIYHWNPALNKT